MARKARKLIGRKRKYSGQQKKEIGCKKKYSGQQKIEIKTEDNGLDFDAFIRRCFAGDQVDNSYSPNNCTLETTDNDGCSANEFYVILDKPYQYLEHDDHDQFVKVEYVRLFSALKEECKDIDQCGFVYDRNSSHATFIKLYNGDIPKIKIAVTVSCDFQVIISVNSKLLPLDHEMWNWIPRVCYSARTIGKVLRTINKYNICIGNPDSHLQSLIPHGAYLDSRDGPPFYGYRDTYTGLSTILSTSCQLLVGTQRCKDCQRYRATLRSLSNRKNKSDDIGTEEKDWKSSKKPDSLLTENQKIHKIKQLKTFASALEKENVKLKKLINKDIKKSGVKTS